MRFRDCCTTAARLSWIALVPALLLAACGGGTTPTDAGADAMSGDASEMVCPTGTSTCGTECVDLQNRRDHCGACGTACESGEACVSGACTIVCPASQEACSGSCVDTSRDRRHCGACGAACDVGEACVSGSCTLSCPEGREVCGGACVDTASDPGHCGACGTACGSDQVCSAGSCESSCGAGLAECSGACVDLANDPGHCGACDTACTASDTGALPICVAGTCRAICEALSGDCNGDLGRSGGDGCETALETDADNCGACGRVCSLDAATAGCVAGGCVVTTCDSGFDDCDSDPANGCEAELALDDANCGACGMACPAGQRCGSGACIDIAGEDCSTAYVLSEGSNTVNWTATMRDYLTVSPPCSSSYAPDGPDVVMSYTATSDQRVTFDFDKPGSNRWTVMLSTDTCGTLVPGDHCVSEYTASTLSATELLTSGETVYLYLVDTTSGSAPLDSPLTVDVTSTNCSAPPAVTFAPADGATTASLSPVFVATFASPVLPAGTLTITGDMGTSLTYDLSAATSENVSFSSDATELTIDPGMSLPPGERLVIDWTGVLALVCVTPIPVPSPSWVVNVATPPCSPGVGGLVGTTESRVATGLSSFTEYYVAADDDPAGWVYAGGTGDLYRIRKAGGAVEDVEALAGLSSSQLGYAMLVNGLDVFTIESTTTTGTSGRLFRITTDGGATWSVQDYASFPTAPADDFRGASVYGGRIYLVTEEDTAGTPTEIWSVDAAAATLPTMATLELSTSDEGDCMAIVRDSTYYYLACVDGGDRVVRIPVGGGASELLTDRFDLSATANTLHGDDLDSDGVFDVLYVQGWYEEAYYICSPATATPYVDTLAVFGTGSSNYGMGFDRSGPALWMLDDDTREFVSFR